MKIIKYLIIITILLGVYGQTAPLFRDLNQALAIQNQYTNQLLKLNVNKSDADNSVNVKLYTSKPYPIQLSPIRKSNNEYIIFLPETYHSVTSKPDYSSCSDTIEDIDVKLIPYIGSNANNGYTKIIVKTKGEDVRLNLSSEVSRQDNSLQQELSKVLKSRQTASVKSGNIKKVSYVAVKPKPVVQPRKVAVVTAKKPQPAPLQVKKTNTTASKPKIAVALKPKLVLREAYKEVKSQPKVQPKPVEQKVRIAVPEAKAPVVAQKPVSEPEYQGAVNNENAPEPVEVAKQAPPEEQAKNPEPKAVETKPVEASKPVPVAANVQPPLNKPKKAGSPVKNMIPIIAGIAALIIIIKILGSLRNRKRQDIPISIRRDMDDEWEEEGTEGVSEQPEEAAPETAPIAAIKETGINKQDQPLQEDMMAQLSQNPVKPSRSNPLKDKGYIEVSPNDLNERQHQTRKAQEQRSEGLKFLAGAEITNGQGIYLVEAENQKVLIGTSGVDVFVLNKFKNVANSKFVVRKTTKEPTEDKDVYFVQVGTWCGLVSSKQDSINLEAVF